MLSLIMFVLYSQLPLINGLERAMLAMLQGRARQLLDRWQQDIQDQSKEFTSLSHKAAAAPNLTRGEKKVAREDRRGEAEEGCWEGGQEVSTCHTSPLHSLKHCIYTSHLLYPQQHILSNSNNPSVLLPTLIFPKSKNISFLLWATLHSTPAPPDPCPQAQQAAAPSKP